MELVSDAQKAVGNLARYVDEFQEFFASHKLPYGSPDDLLELSHRMETPGTFRDELSSMVRSVIFRQGGNVPRAELLKLITTSAGGPEVHEATGQLQEPIRQLMSYLTGVARAPINQPGARELKSAPAEVASNESAPAEAGPGPFASARPAGNLLQPTEQPGGATSKAALDAAALLEELRLVELKNLEVKSQLGSLYERISRIGPQAGVRPESPILPTEPALRSSASAQSAQRAMDPQIEAPVDAASATLLPPTPVPASPITVLPPSSKILPMPAPANREPATLEPVAPEPPLPAPAPLAPTALEPAALELETLPDDLRHPHQYQPPQHAADDPWDENSDLQKVLRRFAEQKAAQAEEFSPARSGMFARLSSPGQMKWIAGSAAVVLLILAGTVLHNRSDHPAYPQPASLPSAAANPASSPAKPNPYDTRAANATAPSGTAPNRSPGTRSAYNDGLIADPTATYGAAPSLAMTAPALNTPAQPSSNPTSLSSDAGSSSLSREADPAAAPDAQGKAHNTRLFGKDPYAAKGGQSRGLNVSSGVMAGNLISAPAPQYPRLASFTHVQGQVLLQAIISKTGGVEHLKVIRGPHLLRGAAMDAVHRWRYRPYTVSGHPVDVATIIRVDFQLHR